MRSALATIGVVLVAVGLVWVGQGLGLIKGSFMTGARIWAWIGAGSAATGAALAAFGLLRPIRR